METLLLIYSYLAQTVETASTGTTRFMDMLARYDTLMITGAAWSVIQAIQKGFPDTADHRISQRLKPGASIFLCTLLAYLPYWRIGTWDETLVYGIVIGGTLSTGHKILGQSILGKDHRINPYVNDPELRKLIDEYVAAKQSGNTQEKKKSMDHLRHWLT